MSIRHGFTKYRILLEVFEYEYNENGRKKVGMSNKIHMSFPQKRESKKWILRSSQGMTAPLSILNNATRSGKKTGRWIAVRDLQNYAFPSPHQKIVAKLISEMGSRKKTRHNKALTYA